MRRVIQEHLTPTDTDVSPPIYSTPLNIINQDRCKFWYSTNKDAFRRGINRMQMCAGDEVVTECPGDTGGPLQIRLLSSSRYTPFVVGVSALGVPCGQTTPGVYIKIAHYIGWIEDVTKKNFAPQECVTRHISFREADEALVAPSSKVDCSGIMVVTIQLTFFSFISRDPSINPI